jgi:hypothetical protein
MQAHVKKSIARMFASLHPQHIIEQNLDIAASIDIRRLVTFG